jgi:hypothetical protein
LTIFASDLLTEQLHVAKENFGVQSTKVRQTSLQHMTCSCGFIAQ